MHRQVNGISIQALYDYKFNVPKYGSNEWYDISIQALYDYKTSWAWSDQQLSSISIQALYDYKSDKSFFLGNIYEFQFKHCTIIRRASRLDLEVNTISIQALYDYKDQRRV